MSRRRTISAGLGAGATLMAGPFVRNSSAQPAAAPGLLAPDAIVRVWPPVVPPPIRWRVVAPDGSVRDGSVAAEAGRGLLLNVWATWCDPCVREMPALARLAVRLAGRPGGGGIDVVPVAFGPVGAAAVVAFYRSIGVSNLAVALDPDGSVRRGFGIAAIPVTLLIDARGRLVGRAEGAVDWDASETRVRRLIGPV